MNVDYNSLHKEWDTVHGEFGGPTYRLRKKIILKLLRKVLRTRDYAHVLDVGCGTGEYTLALARMHARVTAIDISSYALDKAQAQLRNEGIEDVSFQQVDGACFETEERFDVIFLSEILEHIDDDYAFLKKYAEFLKNGGYILCSFPFDPALWSFEDEHAGHKRRYTMERVESLIKSAGLCVDTLFCYGFPFLRTIWSVKVRKKSNYSFTERKEYRKWMLFVRVICRMIAFCDSLYLKSRKGVGIILLAQKCVRV